MRRTIEQINALIPEGSKLKAIGVVESETNSKSTNYELNCACECGNFRVVRVGNLLSGSTSCCKNCPLKLENRIAYKSQLKKIDYKGVMLTLNQISKKEKVSYNTLVRRIEEGLSAEEAVKKIKKKAKNKK